MPGDFCHIIAAMPAIARSSVPARSPLRIVGQSGRNARAAPRRSAPAARGASGRSASPSRGLLFHVPSFSIGIVLGAAIVLITGYLPELLAPPVATPQATTTQPGAAQSAPPPLTFEFDTILRSTFTPIVTETRAPEQPDGLVEAEVPPGTVNDGTTTGALDSTTAVATGFPLESEAEADRPPETVPQPAAEEIASERADYMLQAASFRSRSDADRLRAELLLLDLPASTGEVNVGNSVWYRVTVGPFPDQGAADVARERLRERNLTAIPFKR